jgi:peroxiredoxin
MKKSILIFAGSVMINFIITSTGPFKAGDIATDFSLKNLDGKYVSLSQFNDAKGFIVVFTCNTCPMAKKYEGRIIDLNKEFSGKGYPVIAINSNDRTVSPGDSYEEMQKLATAKGYKFEYLYDDSQEVAKQYGATNTPHVYVLSKNDGKLKVGYVGAIDNNAEDASKADKKYVHDAVNALLKGEQAPVAGTKAIGCGIKWKKADTNMN